MAISEMQLCRKLASQRVPLYKDESGQVHLALQLRDGKPHWEEGGESDNSHCRIIRLKDNRAYVAYCRTDTMI